MKKVNDDSNAVIRRFVFNLKHSTSLLSVRWKPGVRVTQNRDAFNNKMTRVATGIPPATGTKLKGSNARLC